MLSIAWNPSTMFQRTQYTLHLNLFPIARNTWLRLVSRGDFPYISLQQSHILYLANRFYFRSIQFYQHVTVQILFACTNCTFHTNFSYFSAFSGLTARLDGKFSAYIVIAYSGRVQQQQRQPRTKTTTVNAIATVSTMQTYVFWLHPAVAVHKFSV